MSYLYFLFYGGGGGGYVYVGTLLDYGDVYIVPLCTPLHISEDSLASPVRPKARELA
jgi:hypothetical protein